MIDGQEKELIARQLRILPQKHLPSRQVNYATFTGKELNDRWKIGAMDGNPPFVTILFVPRCIYLSRNLYFRRLLLQCFCCFSRRTIFVIFLRWSRGRKKTSAATNIKNNTPKGTQICNLSYQIAEVHTTILHRCARNSTSIFQNLLQNLTRSTLYLSRLHDALEDSLKPDTLSLYIANPIVSPVKHCETTLFI